MLAACGGDAGEARSPRCLPLESAVLRAVEAKLRPDGAALRHGYAVRSDDAEVYFVSAELALANEEELRGDILTWVTGDAYAPADDYRSVDRNAKEVSAWPPASDAHEIRTDGAIESRACVNTDRPG